MEKAISPDVKATVADSEQRDEFDQPKIVPWTEQQRTTWRDAAEESNLVPKDSRDKPALLQVNSNTQKTEGCS